MKIGVLGTGFVGQTIGAKLIELGHEVLLGSRGQDNPKATEWVVRNGAGAGTGTLKDAAAFGEILFNCTAGEHSLEALKSAGSENLERKLLIDVTNPLDFSKGMPSTLLIDNTDSLGESIQRAFLEAKVVKTLNTVNHLLMVNPSLVPGKHTMFVCGNVAAARMQVSEILLNWFGWPEVLDLGDITNARGMEMYPPLWVRLFGALQNFMFNIHVVSGPKPQF